MQPNRHWKRIDFLEMLVVMKQTGNFTTTFGTIFGTKKKITKKSLKREALVINTFRLLKAFFYSNIYKSSAQNLFRAEDFCSIIIEAHQKSEVKCANKKQKATESPQKSHRSPCFVLCLRWFLRVGTIRALRSECVPSHSFRSPNLQYAYSQKWRSDFLYKSHQQIIISQVITCISAKFSVPLQGN